jgi:hypothetical protein
LVVGWYDLSESQRPANNILCMSSFDQAFRQQQAAQSASQNSAAAAADQQRRFAEAAAPHIASLLKQFAAKVSAHMPAQPIYIGDKWRNGPFAGNEKQYSPPAYILSGFAYRLHSYRNDGSLVTPDGTLLRTVERKDRQGLT